MNAHALSFSVDDIQEPAFGAWQYFCKRRAECIAKYRAAEFWVTRRDARSQALHYGRLARMLEGRS